MTANRKVGFAAIIFLATIPASLWAAADLCQGLVKNDKTPHPMTALVKPALGQTVVDPEFGTTIRRITSSTSMSNVVIPMYNTIPAWNADESYLILVRPSDGFQLLYDGKTYAFIRELSINPKDLEQVYWHTSDPDILFYVDRDTNRLIRYHVGADRQEVYRDFSDICPVSTGNFWNGDDPVFNSWDSNYFSFVCTKGDDTNGWAGTFVLLFKVDTKEILAQKPGIIAVDGSQPKPPRLLPTPGLTLWNKNVTDMQLNTLRRISIANPDEHTSFGMTNGNSAFYSVVFDPPDGDPECQPGGCDPLDYVGSLVAYDLTDPSGLIMPKVIVGQKTNYPYPQDSHLSAMAYKNPGWVLISALDDNNSDANPPGKPDGAGLLDLELVYVNTNTGDVYRVAHHRSWGKENTHLGDDGYFAEAHGVPSPTGTRILFASDWGNGTSVDSYVVELPSYGAPGDTVPPARPKNIRMRP